MLPSLREPASYRGDLHGQTLQPRGQASCKGSLLPGQAHELVSVPGALCLRRSHGCWRHLEGDTNSGLRDLSVSKDSDRSSEARQSGCQPTIEGSGVMGEWGIPENTSFLAAVPCQYLRLSA